MKTTTFEQLKTMLKSMSYSIFNRIGSLEAIVKPPHKPPLMQYVTDANGDGVWEDRTHYYYEGDANVPDSQKHKRLSLKYLPEGMYGAVEEETVFLSETTVQMDDGFGLGKTEFAKMPEIGQTIVATYDGVDYECIATASNSADYTMLIGDVGVFGGENNRKIPFGIGIPSPSNIFVEYGAKFIFYTADSQPHTLKIHIPVGFIKRIDLKYLPATFNPVWNIKSTVYDAVLNGTEIPQSAEYYSDLKVDEIVQLFKTGTLGGINFFYSDGTNTGCRVCTGSQMSFYLHGTSNYAAEGFVTISEYDNGTALTVKRAFIQWHSGRNSYTIEIRDTRIPLT